MVVGVVALVLSINPSKSLSISPSMIVVALGVVVVVVGAVAVVVGAVVVVVGTVVVVVGAGGVVVVIVVAGAVLCKRDSPPKFNAIEDCPFDWCQ